MTLAAVQIETSDFDFIRGHLLGFKPPYRNMHLREACQRNKTRYLRYLHAMYAPASFRPLVEGMLSGPGLFWHYKLSHTGRRTQLTVLAEEGSSRELSRIGRRFLPEIIRRIQEEQRLEEHYPRRTRGQFYLRRSRPGAPASHRHCRRAVNEGVLDERFVARLAHWDLELLCP